MVKSRKLPKDMKHVLRSNVQSFKGNHASSSGSVCTNLIIQVNKESGKKPVSVVWHTYPVHVSSHMSSPKLWNNLSASRKKELKKKLQSSLKNGKPSGDVREMPPEVIIDHILDYVHSERKGGSEVVATLVPGTKTMEEDRLTHSKKAFNGLVDMLQERKEAGKIHKVRGVKRGLLRIFIDGKTGEIMERR